MNWKSPLRENLESLLFPLILVLITRTFVFQAFKIPSESMRETLQVGDHILVNKSLYFDAIPGLGISLFPRRDPQRRDILVFKFPKEPGKDYIKRLIGQGGETVTSHGTRAIIDGQPLEETDYVYDDPIRNSMRTSRILPGIKVSPDTYFMMGDNRDNSEDSRYWGELDRPLIKGKAFVIYWSWNDEAYRARLANGGWWWNPYNILTSIRWERMFRLLH